MLGLLIWVGCALGVTLTLYTLMGLARLGAWLLSPDLNRRMARNQVRLSRDRPQIRRRPPHQGRNGSRPRYALSLDPRQGLR